MLSAARVANPRTTIAEANRDLGRVDEVLDGRCAYTVHRILAHRVGVVLRGLGDLLPELFQASRWDIAHGANPGESALVRQDSQRCSRLRSPFVARFVRWC